MTVTAADYKKYESADQSPEEQVIVQLYADRAQTIVAASIEGRIAELKIGQMPVTDPAGRAVMIDLPQEDGSVKQVPQMRSVYDPESGTVVMTHILIGWLRIENNLLEVTYRTQPKGELCQITVKPEDVLHTQKVKRQRLIT